LVLSRKINVKMDSGFRRNDDVLMQPGGRAPIPDGVRQDLARGARGRNATALTRAAGRTLSPVIPTSIHHPDKHP